VKTIHEGRTPLQVCALQLPPINATTTSCTPEQQPIRNPIAVQAAMALREEQMDEACDEYGRLLASLKRLTAEQGAVLSAWPQQPGAVFITTQVRVGNRVRVGVRVRFGVRLRQTEAHKVGSSFVQ